MPLSLRCHMLISRVFLSTHQLLFTLRSTLLTVLQVLTVCVKSGLSTPSSATTLFRLYLLPLERHNWNVSVFCFHFALTVQSRNVFFFLHALGSRRSTHGNVQCYHYSVYTTEFTQRWRLPARIPADAHQTLEVTASNHHSCSTPRKGNKGLQAALERMACYAESCAGLKRGRAGGINMTYPDY